MRRPKRVPWLVFAVFLTAFLICAASGAFPSREKQAEEAARNGDAETLLRLFRDGLDPNTDVCTRYDAPEWTNHFPFTLLPYSALPKVCAAKSSLMVETVRNFSPTDAQTVVMELLHRGVAINPPAGRLPVNEAITKGDADLARFLFDHGATLNPSDARDAFYEALRNRDTRTVRLLLARGANPNERFSFANDQTPLIVAAETGAFQTVELLLQHGAEPNARDRDGDTAVGFAISLNFDNANKREIQTLLRHGASLFIKDKDGVTPFDWLPFTQDFYKANGQTAKLPPILTGPPP